MRALRLWAFGLGVLLCGGLLLGMASPSGAAGQGGGSRAHQIIIPAEDRFTPYALTIGAGDTVQWVNQDTDDHTVVSDDIFTTAGHLHTDELLPGTDSTGGTPSTFTLRFSQPGVFVYYCRFHAHLDPDHQPVAPGPEGGIQDADGNFGTPMTGLITVLPGRGE